MAELKNSQRISYKATYNQVSVSATTGTNRNNPVNSLSRAVEKTAFVQALRIVPQELAALKTQLSGRAGVPTNVASKVPAALKTGSQDPIRHN